MPGLNNTAKNAILDGTTTVWPPDTLSLHTADPGSGTSPAAGEVTGGSPAYARKALTWGAAASGVKSNNASITFDVPGGSITITHAGYWRGTTFLGSRALDTAQTYATQGTYTIATGAITETVP